MTDLASTTATITAATVRDAHRLGFLPRLVGRFAILFESFTYAVASDLSADYKGGYWEFYTLSNGAFYMAPTSYQQLAISVEGNGFSGTVSADAAGVIFTLMGLNRLMWRAPSETLEALFYALRDFAAQHPEASAIFAAID